MKTSFILSTCFGGLWLAVSLFLAIGWAQEISCILPDIYVWLVIVGIALLLGYLRSKKGKTLAEIKKIYHSHGGVDGYRSMRVFSGHKNIRLSAPTVHKYMNKKLGLFAIVRRRTMN